MGRDRDVLAGLYAVDRDAFVAERNALARSLRAEGRDQEADEVAALRKPPLPVHLANRLSHERPREIEALLDTAEKLSKAHGSGDAEALREKQRQLGEQVRALVVDAPAVTGLGLSDPVAQRLSETLRAAAVDKDAAALLRRGVLPEEVESSGFDALAGMSIGSSRGTREAGRAERGPTRAQAERRARAQRLAEDLADARRTLRSAEAALTTAERDAQRARKRVSTLEARLKRAQ